MTPLLNLLFLFFVVSPLDDGEVLFDGVDDEGGDLLVRVVSRIKIGTDHPANSASAHNLVSENVKSGLEVSEEGRFGRIDTLIVLVKEMETRKAEEPISNSLRHVVSNGERLVHVRVVVELVVRYQLLLAVVFVVVGLSLRALLLHVPIGFV